MVRDIPRDALGGHPALAEDPDVKALQHAQAEIKRLMKARQIDMETISRLTLENIDLSKRCQALESVARARAHGGSQ